MSGPDAVADPARWFGVWRRDGADHQVWTVKGDLAHRYGAGDPAAMFTHHLRLRPNQSFRSAVTRLLNEYVGGFGWRVSPMDLAAGEYYPRMARPNHRMPLSPASHHSGQGDLRREYAITLGQMEALIQKLAEVCRFVHPEGQSLKAYGSEIRSLLILACTEVESQWRSVLVANGVIRRDYSTRDYVKLAPAMRLKEYRIVFNRYPWLPAAQPFKHWGRSERVTQDLPWYVAYNAVKHHREACLSDGTLRAALDSVAACAIMTCAQFGIETPLRAMGGFFSMTETPSWRFPEVYVLAGQDATAKAVPYPFT